MTPSPFCREQPNYVARPQTPRDNIRPNASRCPQRRCAKAAPERGNYVAKNVLPRQNSRDKIPRDKMRQNCCADSTRRKSNHDKTIQQTDPSQLLVKDHYVAKNSVSRHNSRGRVSARSSRRSRETRRRHAFPSHHAHSPTALSATHPPASIQNPQSKIQNPSSPQSSGLTLTTRPFKAPTPQNLAPLGIAFHPDPGK
jgi:hypothetical protein